MGLIMSTNLVSDDDGDQPVSVLGAVCYEDSHATSSGDEQATEAPVDVEEYQADSSHDNALTEMKDEIALKSTADVEQEGVSLDIKSSSGDDGRKPSPVPETQAETGDAATLEVPGETCESDTKPGAVKQLAIDVDLESVPSVVDVVATHRPFVYPTPTKKTRLKVRRCPLKALPIALPNQLPAIPCLTEEDRARLQAFNTSVGEMDRLVMKAQTDLVTVYDLQCCKEGKWLEDVVLNVAWKQISKELDASSSHGLKVGYFPSFFLTLLVQEGHKYDAGYNYDGVRHWSKTFLGDTPPLEYDIIVFLRNFPGHWWTYVMFPKHRHIEAFDSMGLSLIHI